MTLTKVRLPTNKSSTTKLMRFLEPFPTFHYDKAEIILFQGEVPRDAFIIKEGVVKVYNIDEAGREQLIHLQSTGDVFPFTWIMSQVPTTQYFYETLRDTIIYKLPKERYLDFISAHKSLLMEALSAQARLDYIKTVRLNAVLHSKAIDKLVHTLHCLMLSNGVTEGQYVTLEVPLSQQDFANMTGLTRETVSIEFGKLKKNGLLNVRQSRYYQLNPELFKQYTSDQFLS